MNTLEILKQLIAFPTVSIDPNRALIDYCDQILRGIGAKTVIIEDETGTKANLFATIGATDRPGVLLSGHTDVVPIAGQNWTKEPFTLTQEGDKLFGRGTTDMKGFVASALSAAIKASKRNLKTPLHLALSYDEEIGCIGVRSMIDMLKEAPFKPVFCIVGEPTLMAVATGHKGKTAARVQCTGQEAHSALAPTALNAIHLACDMIAFIRSLQEDVAANNLHDDDYDIPYTTLHVGRINGGVALNIVPNNTDFFFEIRNLPEDNPAILMEKITAHADKLIQPLKAEFPQASVDIEITNTYPPLGTAKDADVVGFVTSLTGKNATIKVAFGTEGGLFANELGIPTVVCGPGSMDQGHKPDEYIELDQLTQCDAMMDTLINRLEAGI
ncbi:MAG: acetylornithine deacetylase [Hyphomicrobiales bacterium]